MSQNKVYEALKEINGEGTTTELREHLAEKYPHSTLSDYAVNRLRRLEEKNIVEIDDESVPYHVVISDEDWEGVQKSLANRDFPPHKDE